MDNQLLKIKHLTKVFDGRQILNDIALIINKGDIVFVSGKSGEGKTTFLRVLAGIEESEGEIECNGLSLKELVAYVPQQNSLWENLRVIKNITLYRTEILKEGFEKAKQEVKPLLELLKIDHLENRYPAKLSQGEHQRVALARAFATERNLLLLDEVTANLDNENRLIIFDVINKMRIQGKSFVFVTHDLYFIKLFQDYYLELKEGTLQTKKI